MVGKRADSVFQVRRFAGGSFADPTAARRIVSEQRSEFWELPDSLRRLRLYGGASQEHSRRGQNWALREGGRGFTISCAGLVRLENLTLGDRDDTKHFCGDRTGGGDGGLGMQQGDA